MTWMMSGWIGGACAVLSVVVMVAGMRRRAVWVGQETLTSNHSSSTTRMSGRPARPAPFAS